MKHAFRGLLARALLALPLMLVALPASAAGQAGNRDRGPEKIFSLYCQGCHRADGEGPGTVMLAERKKISWAEAAIRGNSKLQPDYIRTVVRKGLLEMAPFRKTEINDRELDALIDWLRKPVK